MTKAADEVTKMVDEAMRRFHEADRVVRALSDCPTGATEAALAALGIARATLDRMVARGRVRMTTDRLRGGMTVPRFHLVSFGGPIGRR